MRSAALVTLVLVVMGVGCVGPHSNGAVWATQNLNAERAMYRLGDARRAQMAHDFELSLTDETLSAESQRVSSELQTCPGPQQAFAPSPGDTVRDTVRIRAQGDAARMQAVANIALADWFSRRARATDNAGYCQRAQAALDGNPQGVPKTNLLEGFPQTTVTRDPAATPAAADAGTLSNYALGYLDAVTGAAPVPQYLALVYGGTLKDAQPAANPEVAANMVDAQAGAFPEWEPDALYAALRGGAWP